MKILLLSEAPMSVSEGGICQTLFNIFSFVKPMDLLGVSPCEELRNKQPDNKYYGRYIGYKSRWIEIPRNRIGHALAPIIQWVNSSLCNMNRFDHIKRSIKVFAPDVVISCPNSVLGIVMHEKLFSDWNVAVRVIPYFMDDWMYKGHAIWLGGSLQKNIKKMLQRAEKWMMISNELSDILKNRYLAHPDEVLCVRNPVDVRDAPADEPYKKGTPFVIAYAGALWDMHYDSFCLFSKAIQLLSNSTNVRLILYTHERFWEWRRRTLEPLGVDYGGHVSYDQIHATLYTADALLITSSFSDALYTHAKASLQTKITDYLKSKRLIISCGPSYSANHTFIRKNDCGVCIESPDVELIAQKVKRVIDNIESYQDRVRNGWNVLNEDFSKDVIHKNVKLFLLKDNQE